MRAAATDWQLERLARLGQVVDRVTWFLGHYLADDPERSGLALALLCPTRRDSLLGAIRTVVEAQAQMTNLTLRLVGLDKPAAVGDRAAPPADAPAAPELELSPEELACLPVEYREALELVMGMVTGQAATREPPMPPPPPS